MPCEEFQARGEGVGVDCGEDLVPDFDEVAATCVGEDAEAGVGDVGGEDIADELVATDGAGGIAWETGEVEDGFEVAVALDEAGGGSLEVGFGELGLEEEGSELEVDFGAVG